MPVEIETVIQQLFPEHLITLDAFDDWFSSIRIDLDPAAADLITLLDQKLDEEANKSRETTPISRDFWERFGGEGHKLIKSAKSVRSKLARDLLREKKTSRLTEEQIHQQIYNFSDLGRVRIVADFTSDIKYLKKNLFSEKKFLGQYKCPKGIKDFIFDPSMRNGLKGHRALQFSVRLPINSNFFGFEIQLMTRLQHAWDRRNHPLYEWQRENLTWQKNASAIELSVNDFSCAEALHLVDQQADQNWQKLKKLLRNPR